MDYFSFIVRTLGVIIGGLLFMAVLNEKYKKDNSLKSKEYAISLSIFMFVIGNLVTWIFSSFFYMIFFIIFK